MSTPATAAARTPEKDGTSGKQLHLMAAAATQTELAETANTVNSDAARVERLISQLEARSMALVPYGLGSIGALRELPPPPKPGNSAMIAAGLVAVWISTMAFGIAYIRYSNRLSEAPERAAARPLVIPNAGDAQDQQVARSVDHLAKALVSSSERLNQLQAEMDRSNKDWQRLAVKVSDNNRRKVETVAAPQPVPQAPAPLLTINPAAATPAAPLPKNWHQVIDLKPSDGAVPHQSAEGAIDYWLVPRGGDKSQLSKVLPIGRSAEGVVIHNLEDGRDYTLTAAGEWKNGGLAESPK